MEDIKRQVEEAKSIDNYRFNQRREPLPVRPESAGSVLDSERIDWLEGNNAEIHHGPDYVFVETDRHHEDRPTLREAIDVAMGDGQANQKPTGEVRL